MDNSYSLKYLKIYIWQAISFVLSFVSLFIVVPSLSSMPGVYGVYSLCVGMTIFLSYADLGFINAGTKFASECFVSGKIEEEKSYVGQATFVYSVIASVMLLLFLCFSYNPCIILSGINPGSEEFYIAQKLLLILSLSIPVYVVQKYVFLIYNVRLLDYKVQKVQILGALVRIASVPLVFFNGRYDIVGYYGFSQIVLCCAAVYMLWKSKEFSYGFISIFRVCRYNKVVFSKMKSLAFSGILACVSWILYYELDSLAIGKFLGVQAVAYYAIAFSLASFIRSAFAIFFSPYNVRFNYFVGESDFQGLASFCRTLISFSSVLVIPPLIALMCLAKPFVFAWVGDDYASSVLVFQLLVGCFLLAYITYPLSFLQTALKQVKAISIVSMIVPVVYWSVICLLIDTYGLYSFAFSKLLAFAISAFVCILFSLSNIQIGFWKYMNILFLRPVIYSAIPALILSLIAYHCIPFGTARIDLLFVMVCVMGISAAVWGLNILINRLFRERVFAVSASVMKRNK